MAASAEPLHEVPHWLKTLPVAPEFHPTLAEFEDPITYILKIEKEASHYGICKIVPPVGLPSRKTTLAHLNRSLTDRNRVLFPDSKPGPTFTTRFQQIGFDPRRGRPVQKPVWQSGESYTLQQFEARARAFEKSHLKPASSSSSSKKGKGYSALEIEALFWRASVDKPFTVEYANDMPGSAFAPLKPTRAGEGATVAETAWNMRGVARGKGSLLRFMKEEIPGVTSPMVYIAMLFSWFAWHVEDHDLHSLNYMHMGAAKTWYGVPKDAALAFQDVVRVEGYGGDLNPLVTFATLGEKTTVMSPEVLIGAGIPCCRLVQNVGEFVVTFPGAYHSGFSHGYNCAEASNIATPEWLRFAKEAAIRRASINCPPMVSHFQLLYALALALCSRNYTSISNEPRSSRLKDKKKGEGEGMVKEFFVQSVIQNNDLLHLLLSHGSSCVLLPRNSSEISMYLSRRFGTQKTMKRMMSLGLCSNDEASKTSDGLLSDEKTLEKNVRFRHLNSINALNKTAKSTPLTRNSVSLLSIKPNNHGSADLVNSSLVDTDTRSNSASQDTGLLEKGLFPCVQCGILGFACAAIVEPKEAAAQYFMSVDSSIFSDWKAGSGILKAESTIVINNENNFQPNDTSAGGFENSVQDCLYDVPVQSGEYEVQVSDQRVEENSPRRTENIISSLDLLASVYGNSSDSDEELVEPEMVMDDANMRSQKQSENDDDDSGLHSPPMAGHQSGASGNVSFPQSPDHGDKVSVQVSQCASYSRRKRKWTRYGVESQSQQTSDCSLENDVNTLAPTKFKCTEDPCTDKGFSPGRIATASAEILGTDLYTNQIESAQGTSSVYPRAKFSHSALLGETTKYSNSEISIQNTDTSLIQISKAESSRMHIFCLEHAVEVEKQLQPIGGANILLLCHPEYPKAEEEAKLMALDLGIDHLWKDISLGEVTKEDQEKIALALDNENASPGSGDWAVKLGINLYYSANLSKSPLYTKQMPYNSVIYKAFGCSSTNYPMEVEVSGKAPGKQKKIFVAGKWCGKVWMSNQVHPYLAKKESEEDDSLTFNNRAASCLKSSLKSEKKVGTSRSIREPVASEEKPSPMVTTTTDRKHGQKKIKWGKAAKKKIATPKVESSSQTTEYSSESDSSSLSNGRSLRNDQTSRRRPVRQYSSLKNIRQFDSSSKVKVESGPTIAKKSEQKKRKIEKVVMKPESESESESPSQTAEDSSDSDSSPLSNGRFLRNEQNKRIRPLISPCTVKPTRQNDSHLKLESEDGPSTRLRKRPSKLVEEEVKPERKQTRTVKAKKALPTTNAVKNEETDYHCDLDGCTMGFSSKHELVLHKRNVCPVKGCGKKFFSHKYLVQHRRVHIDDRPLKCPWKGCKMTFKWAWARTEHIRVHTGDRPYVCREKGCGQTFRFVSDFSRHKRKTGHSVKTKG